MNQNVIALLLDPVFLSSVLEAPDVAVPLRHDPQLRPTKTEVEEAAHILMTLDRCQSHLTPEELEQLKKRILCHIGA